MGVLTDYFVATDNQMAAGVIDWPSGPGYPPDGVEALPTVEGKMIDPFVVLGALETALTGITSEEIFAADKSDGPIAMIDEGMRLVLPTRIELAHALLAMDPGSASGVAEEWSDAPEFSGAMPSDHLAGIIGGLRNLAVTARDTGGQIYCWICV